MATQSKMVRAAIRAIVTARPNRRLVEEGFKEHLKLLRLPARKVVFYPNLRAACDSDTTRNISWDIAMEKFHSLSPWDTDREPTDSLQERMDALYNARLFAWRDLGAKIRNEGLTNRDRSGNKENKWDTCWELAWSGAIFGYTTPMQPFIEIAQGGCLIFWVARKAVHVVLAAVYPEDVEFHREEGPVIEYEDGTGIYYWNNLKVSENLVLHPEKMTVVEILAERNVELRRVMIERYGQEKFIRDADVEILDIYNGNELVRIPLPNDPDDFLTALKLRCTSTGRQYFIRVPPRMRDAQQALAWSFDLNGRELYKLEAET